VVALLGGRLLVSIASDGASTGAVRYCWTSDSSYLPVTVAISAVRVKENELGEEKGSPETGITDLVVCSWYVGLHAEIHGRAGRPCG
jgi:hypothetical protein